MYFKEKEDTNIDKEKKKKRKKNSNFDINKILKNPKILLIGGGIVIAIILHPNSCWGIYLHSYIRLIYSYIPTCKSQLLGYIPTCKSQLLLGYILPTRRVYICV